MLNDKNSNHPIKKSLGSIRQQRKLSEFDRIRSIRKQYAAELSVVRDALNSSVSGVIIADLEGNIRYVNNTFLRLFEYDGKVDVYGKNAADLFASDKVRTFADVKAIIDRASGEAEEFEVLRRNGTSFPVEVSASYVTDSEGNVVGRMASFFDISKRKQAEKDKRKLEVRLLETQRLEAIATLAGGIAHEFNNALQGIMGNLEMLKKNFDDNIGIKEYAKNMEAQTHRLVKLTKQLMAFSKGGKYRTTQMAVNNLVSETLELIRHAITPDIQIVSAFKNAMYEIDVDPVQLKMVISSVVLNAVEAIEGSGKITIRTHDFKITGESDNAHDSHFTDSYICISVEDTGKGMDEAIRKRMFDPFFTTKFQGRGLGMAAAHGIVQNHGGWIEVESQPKKGTLVKIYLPAAESRKLDERS
ncbi:MAG: PAS domain S-box protein [Deltaproteobacteria bacterium]|jgi:PAS domain S-box-containing protein|nr:PAS domain S-box protein [Deltaproteobacteria bacterium]